jgi:hypothetical protein
MTTTPTVGEVVSGFGPRTPPPLPGGGTGTADHKGVDISAVAGTPVVAPQAGIVATAAYGSARGHYVVIVHDTRWATLHQHLATRTVVAGDHVTEAHLIGRVGSTGASQAPHLHTEVHDYGTPIDPAEWYRARGVTLGASVRVLAHTITRRDPDVAQILLHPNGTEALAGPGTSFVVLHDTQEAEALIAAGAADQNVIRLPNPQIWDLLVRVAQRASTYHP